MINIKYAGTFQDFSGYGSANRAFIVSLFMAGANLTTEIVVQVQEKSNYGLNEKICQTLIDRKIPYKFKIIHLTPDMYPRYIETSKYNIGHLFWECDKLPKEWVTPCNQMAEIWTSSQRSVEIIKSSGVTVPVYAFPQPLDVTISEEQKSPFQMKYKKDFIFYSIFQWIERKNPRALLRAYWRAFEGNNDVTLLLKTYRVNYTVEEFDKIKRDINEWKAELNLTHYPKIFLVKKLLTHQEMEKLHTTCDVYVNSSSGEGWCRPLQEAMVLGKPVISGDNGGLTDYLTGDHYLRVPSKPKKVKQVSWIPWYADDQKWWEIDEEGLVKAFKDIYFNQNEFKVKAQRAKQWVINNCSYQIVGQKMLQRLSEIEKIL